VDGAATQISVGPSGLPWVVNSGGGIYERLPTGWVQRPGCAKDIGVGADGSVWVIGCNAEGGGWGIYRYKKDVNDWQKIPGAALRISALNEVSASVVND
jgi:Tectonin domain